MKILCRSILGREADTWEIENDVQSIVQGRSIERVVNLILDSREYHRRVQKGLARSPQPDHMADFIHDLYQIIFDRNPENQDVVTLQSKVAYDRGLVTTVTSFLNSVEYHGMNLPIGQETISFVPGPGIRYMGNRPAHPRNKPRAKCREYGVHIGK